MAKGRLQHAIDKYRQQLLQREAKAIQALEAAYSHALAAIKPQLDKLYDEMMNGLANGEKLSVNWLYEAQRLENIKKLITNQINQYAAIAQQTTLQSQHFAANLGQQSALDMLKAAVPDGLSWSFGTPSPKAIIDLVGVTQDGSPLAELFKGFGEEAANDVARTLINGVTLGDNPRTVAKQVEQDLGVSRNRALTISRQEMIRPYRSASLETMRENDNVAKGWQWNAAKSSRTCGMCLAMDGTEHSLDEEFESHVACRCAPSPVTRDWSDILSDAGIDTASLDIPEMEPRQTGADWFKEQPEHVKQQILGKAKLAAYNDGAFELKDLVHHGNDSQWGGYRREKSLKSVLGAKGANKYYGK